MGCTGFVSRLPGTEFLKINTILVNPELTLTSIKKNINLFRDTFRGRDKSGDRSVGQVCLPDCQNSCQNVRCSYLFI